MTQVANLTSKLEPLGFDCDVRNSQGRSYYVTVSMNDNEYKVRISDHAACYECDYSISPSELTVDQVVSALCAANGIDYESARKTNNQIKKQIRELGFETDAYYQRHLSYAQKLEVALMITDARKRHEV